MIKNVVKECLLSEEDFSVWKDKTAKKVLVSDGLGKRYAARIIANVTGIKLQDIENNLEYMHPNIALDDKVVESVSDIPFENNKAIFNIEVNRSNGKYTVEKNNVYSYHLILRQIKKQKDYKNIKPVNIINIDNYDYFEENELLYKCMMVDLKSLKPENKNIAVYHVNLTKLKEMGYNEIRNSELSYLMFLFACNNEEKINELYEGDDFMKELKKEVKRITGGTLWGHLYYAPEDLARDNRELAIEEGKTLGIEEGAKTKAIEIAKSLLEDKFPIETIAKHTGLSIEEIKDLEK